MMTEADRALVNKLRLFANGRGDEWTRRDAEEAGRIIRELDAERDALRRRCERLESSVRWALGESGDFRSRKDGEGAYWWRTELRKRAELKEASDGR